MTHILAAVAVASLGLMLYVSSILLALFIIAFLLRKSDSNASLAEHHRNIMDHFLSDLSQRRIERDFSEPSSKSREDRGR